MPSKPIKQGRVDKTKLIALKKKGATHQECADIMGVSKAAISKQFRKLEVNPAYKGFRENKADILESLQAEIIVNGISGEKIKEASLQQAVTAIGILNDKIRTEREQTTSYTAIDIRAMIAHLAKSSDTIAEQTE